MTYEIRENAQFGSREIYFEGKPEEAIREALKAIKCRWNNLKKCWYSFATESQIVSAITGATPEEEKTDTAVVTDGYLGGGAVYGGKSHLGLYGQDLKKAIMDDIKKAGIKGVTLAMNHGSIDATIKTTSADIITLDEFLRVYEVMPSFQWISYTTDDGRITDIHIEKYFALSPEEKETIRISAAKLEYKKEIESRCALNEYHLDKYHGFSEAGMKRIKTVRKIILAYRYDESNAMVDYFNTNFYYNLITKPTEAAQ